MVRKSGADATAVRTGSCQLLRMPTPMHCPLEVRHDGVDIFADPGTYCYHGEPAWREWFRSTAGHNTVELDSLNQAESGGPFLWTTQVRTTTLTCDVGEQPVQTWSAEHDGYLRLKNPTTHRRSVTLDSPQRRLTIVDTFDRRPQGSSSATVLALRPRRPSRSKRSPRNAFLAGRPGHQARHAHTSRGPGVDLSSGQGRPDRRLVFAPLCRSRTRQFPDRERNCIELNPPRHPAGVALSRPSDRLSVGSLRHCGAAGACWLQPPRGSGGGRCLRVGFAAPTDQHHFGAAAHTCPCREQQLRH